MELPPETIEHLLDAWPVARLATVGADGAPHQVPLVFARLDGRLWSPIDGKPKRGGELVRIRNVRAHPRVSLLLDAYGEAWDRLWWLRVDGDARVVERDAPEVVERLVRKYPQYARTPLQRGAPQWIAVAVRSLSSWCAGPAALEGLRDTRRDREG